VKNKKVDCNKKTDINKIKYHIFITYLYQAIATNHGVACSYSRFNAAGKTTRPADL